MKIGGEQKKLRPEMLLTKSVLFALTRGPGDYVSLARKSGISSTNVGK
jgi:hypothetical protein